jgi:tetratricopeptide (TPR) repeat protein
MKNLKNNNFKFNLLILGICLFLTFCGTSREVAITDSNLVRSTSTQIPADFLKLWEKRHIESELKVIIPRLNQLTKDNPSSYELLIMAARANYIMADGPLYLKLNDDNEALIKEEQKKSYDAAISFAEKAMALDPNFRKAVVGGAKVEEAINNLSKDYIESIYWRYASLSRWSRLEGTTTILKNKAKATQMAKRVEALDPNFLYGAAYRFFGSSETLSPAGSAAKGKEFFEKSIKIENNFFGSHVLYADIYATKKGDVKLFDKELNFVINSKPEALGKPELIPEQIIEQQKAKKILTEKDQRNLE